MTADSTIPTVLLPALLDRIIHATPNPVIAADLQGKVLVFNHAAEKLLGYEAGWVCERMDVRELYMEPDEAHGILGAIRKSSEGVAEDLNIRLRCRNGGPIPIRLSASMIHNPEGEEIATVGVFVDRREEVALQGRLESTAAQLIESEHRAQTAGESRRWAAELNQPLTAALGLLELLSLADTPPANWSARLRRITEQLERMSSLVRALDDALPTQPAGYETATRRFGLEPD
jgi:PAS domain S-box-containing protein